MIEIHVQLLQVKAQQRKEQMLQAEAQLSALMMESDRLSAELRTAQEAYDHVRWQIQGTQERSRALASEIAEMERQLAALLA